ncbi:BspA family leucine-rich repeat surface protein [Vibrio parahaemolyticus]|uniref:BspA family leucine-rich repeat surface protein n=2 Tax=Vibrio parahaemolyticus TaxID=670 RepID=UPI00215D3D3F|nr:BspA family leucine-rich repeat surface protein [Vibrio parahaemolyticus]EKH9208418.1 BspA family leucine-rich repeat surface protein [Vibrio parahaemolyticus]MCR9918424.1 BspA family leucine-rich repeat surface protein [Vibrio parahaemolyticus]
MKLNVLTLSLLSVISLNANAAFVAVLDGSVAPYTTGGSNPPQQPYPAGCQGWMDFANANKGIISGTNWDSVKGEYSDITSCTDTVRITFDTNTDLSLIPTDGVPFTNIESLRLNKNDFDVSRIAQSANINMLMTNHNILPDFDSYSVNDLVVDFDGETGGTVGINIATVNTSNVSLSFDDLTSAATLQLTGSSVDSLGVYNNTSSDLNFSNTMSVNQSFSGTGINRYDSVRSSFANLKSFEHSDGSLPDTDVTDFTFLADAELEYFQVFVNYAQSYDGLQKTFAANSILDKWSFNVFKNDSNKAHSFNDLSHLANADMTKIKFIGVADTVFHAPTDSNSNFCNFVLEHYEAGKSFVGDQAQGTDVDFVNAANTQTVFGLCGGGKALTTRAELDAVVAANRTAELKYANVSQITDFSSLFAYKTLNADISSWDVSKGTDFSYMFNDTKSFNFDISGWDTSKGTHFIGMFQYNQAFDQDISGWNVSSVNDPSWDARNFRQGAILNYNHIPPSFL